MAQIILDDIPIMFLVAENMAAIPDTFRKLEARLSGLKGRKFYGLFHNNIYKASVAIQPDDNPKELGLEAGLIPSGKYLSEKMNDWRQHIAEIGPRFMAMAAKNDVDNSRPSIEFYKSSKVLILYLPIK